jgi:hypothetical protein
VNVHGHGHGHGSRCVGEIKSVGQIAGEAAKESIDNLVGGGGNSDPLASARMSQAVATKAASKPPVITKWWGGWHKLPPQSYHSISLRRVWRARLACQPEA